MSRTWFAIGGLLTVISVGLLTWRLLTATPPQAGEPNATPVGTPAAESAPTPPRAVQPAKETQATPIAGQSFRELDAVATASQPARRGKKLYVVRADDDAPAAGAVVEFVGVDSVGELLAGPDPFAGPEHWKRQELVADDDGIVVLPRFKQTAFVTGRSGELVGKGQLVMGDLSRAKLKLFAPLSVLVTSEAGIPIPEVPVALLNRTSWGVFSIDLKSSESDGVARLVPPEKQSDRRKPLVEERGSYRVAIAIPLADAVEVPFDPDKPPSGPMRLVLPPTNRITVKLVRPDAAPFTEGAIVRICAKDSLGSAVINGDPIGALTARSIGGVATFPFVGVGPALAVEARPADPGLRAAKGVVEGSRAAGAETTATLTCGAAATVVKGRLLDASSKPLANVRFDARFSDLTERDGPRHRSWTTDADGRFTIRFDQDPANLTATELWLNVFADKPPGTGFQVYVHRGRKLTIPIPSGPRNGPIDVGDVVLAELGAFVTGRVVSTDGGKVGGAEVVVMEKWGPGWMQASELHELNAVAGLDGSFKLRGNADRTDLGLIAKREGWICVNPTPFAVGDFDVRVVMTKAGGLEGSLVGFGKMDSRSMSDAPVEIFVTGPEARVAARNCSWRSNDGRLQLDVSNGEFKTRELVPSTYAVELFAAGSNEPLLVVDGLVVTAGETNRDPRLQRIDLSKLMKTRMVTVVDADDRPLQGAKVAAIAVQDGSRVVTTFETDAQGRAIVATTGAATEIVIALRGYRSATIANESGDATVTLRKAEPRPVTIRLDDSVELPPPPFFIEADLKWLCGLNEPRPSEVEWGDPRNDNSADGSFRGNRSVIVMVQDPGVYQVHLWLIEEDISGSGGSGLDQKGGSATVTVTEDGPASLTVIPDERDIKNTIERAKKK